MTCYFRISSRHAIQEGVSEPKIISLYLVMVSLMASSSSSLVSCSFDAVYSTFLKVLTVMSCSFIISFVNPGRLQKSLKTSFYTLKNPSSSSLNMLHCCFSARCIYTLQHIPEDDNFYLVCRQNQYSILPLHYNACRMEHSDHENLPLCVLSTFSTCHWRTCLHFLSVLSPFFQITVIQPHSKSFYIETPTLFPQRYWMTLYRQSFILL